MPWLFLLACVLLVAGQTFTYVFARKRLRELASYVEGKYPDVYRAKLAGATLSDRAVGDFLRSGEDFGDARLAALKKRTLFASKAGLYPLLAVLGLMVVLTVLGALRYWVR